MPLAGPVEIPDPGAGSLFGSKEHLSPLCTIDDFAGTAGLTPPRRLDEGSYAESALIIT